MAKDTGGPAFPQAAYTRPNGEFEWGQDGMTLRDWFAGQALAGISGTCLTASGHVSDPGRQATVASIAYGLADAMLAKRGKAEVV